MHADERPLTLEEAAELLRMAPCSLRRRVIQGDVAACKVAGSGRLLFRREDLEKALRYVRDEPADDGGGA